MYDNQKQTFCSSLLYIYTVYCNVSEVHNTGVSIAQAIRAAVWLVQI